MENFSNVRWKPNNIDKMPQVFGILTFHNRSSLEMIYDQIIDKILRW